MEERTTFCCCPKNLQEKRTVNALFTVRREAVCVLCVGFFFCLCVCVCVCVRACARPCESAGVCMYVRGCMFHVTVSCGSVAPQALNARTHTFLFS